jgi:uncharacterized protein (TIGR02271 family)
MSYHNIVAVFDAPAQAAAAVKALKAAGFADADISIFDKKRVGNGGNQKKFWKSLFEGQLFEHEGEVYSQAIDRNGAVVCLRTMDNEVLHATGILDLFHPIDVNDRAVTLGIAPAAHVKAAAAAAAATPLVSKQTVAVSPKLAAANAGVLRLAEEQLNVGKQKVETGRTRVRRFVTERPVSADVTLHEEHAEIMRKAINNPVDLDSIDWADNDIEVVETAEHALVKKTARIVEEVSLGLKGSDHVETVHDKVRRQQVEIERLPGRSATATPAPSMAAKPR